MGRIINFTNTIIAAGAVAGAAAGVEAVRQYEASFESAHADTLAPVVQGEDEFYFWEDASPEIAAGVYGGFIGAIIVGSAVYGFGNISRQRRSADV